MGDREREPPDVIDLYRRVWAHSDATITELGLDSLGYVPWWNEEVPLFNVMVHRLSDATRHAGHADILREGLDGALGVGPDSAPPTGLDEFGRARRDTVERAARAAAGPDSAPRPVIDPRRPVRRPASL